jgi:hypothetical protein
MDNLPKTGSVNDASSTIAGSAGLQTTFLATFGVAFPGLSSAPPVIGFQPTTTTVAENATLTFSPLVNHANPSYPLSYSWQIDGVEESTATSFNYSPGPNDQGTKVLTLKIGQNNGSGSVNTGLPHYNKNFTLTVQNTVLPTSPSFSLNTPAASPVSTTSISVDIDTGTSALNCESFDYMALTESATAPGLGAFTLSCDSSPTKTVGHTLSGGDGNKTLYLWSVDSASTISASASTLVVALDTTAPTATVTTPGALMGGATETLSFSASDAVGISAIGIQYASDGTTYVHVATLAGGATSYDWTVPSDDVAGAKIKVIAVDSAGQLGSAESAAFTVDSTAPGAPSSSITQGDYTTGTSINLTVASCAGIAEIAVGEGASPGSFSACSTGAGAFAHTFDTATNEAKTIKTWARDAVGNVSTNNVNVITYDNVAPVLGVTNETGILRGGFTEDLQWTMTEVNSAATQTFTLEYSTNNGTTWNSIGTEASMAGPLSAQAFSHTWTIPIVNTDQGSWRVSFTDLATNTATVTNVGNFTIDSASPTVTNFVINTGSASTSNNTVQIAIDASDAQTPITELCVQRDSNTIPAANSSCWLSVTSPAVGLAAASTTISLSSFNFTLPFVDGVYTLYGFVKDSAGNISELSAAGVGTDGTDKDGINYSSGTPPEISQVLAVSSDVPTGTPTIADKTVTVGNDVYIKWKASDAEGLATNPITLYYTTDNSTYTQIASGLSDGANGACTPDNGGTTADDGSTGCYVWTGGSPASSYFRVQAIVEDSAGTTAGNLSNSINTASVNFIAGNTDRGLGQSAKKAVLGLDPSQVGSSSGVKDHLIVLPGGIIVFMDHYLGIVYVDPSTGKLLQLLKKDDTAASNAGDGGVVTAASTRFPRVMVSTFDGHIIFIDDDRIRKITINYSDLQLSTVDTIAGGGADPSNSVTNATDLQTGYGNQIKGITLFTTPDRKIYFESAGSKTVTEGFAIRVYDETNPGVISNLIPSGTGVSGNAGADIGGDICDFWVALPIFKADQSIDYFIHSVASQTGQNCGGFSIAITTATLAARTDITYPTASLSPLHYRWQYYVGMDMNSYAFVRPYGRVRKYNPATEQFDIDILGTGTAGYCADGTAATSCQVSPESIFVTATGVLYFLERGTIRVVDDSGNVQTIFGQPLSFGDGGAAVDARFNFLANFQQKSTGEVVVLDTDEAVFRQFSIGGNITKLAGNGTQGTPDTTSLATTQPIPANLNGRIINFALSSDDEIFYQRADSVAKIDDGTGRWVEVVGGGATNYADPGADGLTGNNIDFSTHQQPRVTASGGSNILVHAHRYYSGGYKDGMLLMYDKDTGTQDTLVGVPGAISGDTFKAQADGTALSAFNIAAVGFYFYPSVWDAGNSRWLTTSFYRPNHIPTYQAKVVRTLPPGGTIGTLTTVDDYIRTFDYRLDGATEIIYYCNNSGVLKKKIVGGAETTLSFGVPGMVCEGHRVKYDATRDSLLFIYQLNGMTGMAEFLSP